MSLFDFSSVSGCGSNKRQAHMDEIRDEFVMWLSPSPYKICNIGIDLQEREEQRVREEHRAMESVIPRPVYNDIVTCTNNNKYDGYWDNILTQEDAYKMQMLIKPATKTEKVLVAESKERVLVTICEMFAKEIFIETLREQLENNNNYNIEITFDNENNNMSNEIIERTPRGKAISNSEIVVLLDCYWNCMKNVNLRSSKEITWINVREMSFKKGVDRTVRSIRKIVSNLLTEYQNAMDQHADDSNYTFRKFTEEIKNFWPYDYNETHVTYAGELMNVIISNENIKVFSHPRIWTLQICTQLLFINIVI